MDSEGRTLAKALTGAVVGLDGALVEVEVDIAPGGMPNFLVAGLLAAHWGNAEFAGLRPYTLMGDAAGEHDIGWWEWEIQPTLNADGHPIDYISSIKTLGPCTRRTMLSVHLGRSQVSLQDAIYH
jgi:hypothetical protein